MTVSELAIKSFFPLDAATADALRSRARRASFLRAGDRVLDRLRALDRAVERRRVLRHVLGHTSGPAARVRWRCRGSAGRCASHVPACRLQAYWRRHEHLQVLDGGDDARGGGLQILRDVERQPVLVDRVRIVATTITMSRMISGLFPTTSTTSPLPSGGLKNVSVTSSSRPTAAGGATRDPRAGRAASGRTSTAQDGNSLLFVSPSLGGRGPRGRSRTGRPGRGRALSRRTGGP